MRVSSLVKQSLQSMGSSSALPWLVTQIARRQNKGVLRIFRDGDLWIHETAFGYFAYQEPYIRLDMRRFDELARANFFWGCKPAEGSVIVDVGAGAGEETLTFSRAVGPSGRVICIEAHPRTYRCLQALIKYNHLKNVVALHAAITEPGRSVEIIENSSNYIGNRVGASIGSAVPASTLDTVVRHLGLDRINFLKMNIEGAERLAIQGMSETLKQTEVVCIACHDFLADKTGDDSYRTHRVVCRYLQQSGCKLVERQDPDLPAYVRYQVWGYNQALRAALAS